MQIGYQAFGIQNCLALAVLASLMSGCGSDTAVSGRGTALGAAPGYDYVIGADDNLQLFVWKNPELSVTTAVRPDGKISLPLIEEIQAAGRTPVDLAHEIRDRLADYVHDPIVTVMPTTFVGPFNRQIRVIGEAAKPRAFTYRLDMTVLDVMIEVGGLTEFAAGNRAVIIRKEKGREISLGVKLDNLIRDGDVSANVPMVAGDILIIPQSWF